jgi:large subunit ribosomal protein L10
LSVAERVYNQKKTQTLQTIFDLAQRHKVIAATKLYKVRATQLMALRKNFRKEMTILVVKNRVAALGFKKTAFSHVDEFAQRLEGQNALIFTDMNPFKLYLTLEKNKVNLAARAGDMATDDILIPAGNTGIPPGPILSDFKEAGVPTRIDTGSIWVAKDTVVAEKSKVISPKLAGLLSKLGVKPIRAGVSVFSAYAEGLVLEEKEIRVDLDEYRQTIVDFQKSAFILSMSLSYPTVETTPALLVRAYGDARILAVASGYVSREVIDCILADNQVKAVGLYNFLKGRGYS